MNLLPPMLRRDRRRAPPPVIRIEKAGDFGLALADLRFERFIPRRRLARHVAEHTGTPANTVEDQLRRYEKGEVDGPDLNALIPILNALDYELAYIPRED